MMDNDLWKVWVALGCLILIFFICFASVVWAYYESCKIQMNYDESKTINTTNVIEIPEEIKTYMDAGEAAKIATPKFLISSFITVIATILLIAPKKILDQVSRNNPTIDIVSYNKVFYIVFIANMLLFGFNIIGVFGFGDFAKEILK